MCFRPPNAAKPIKCPSCGSLNPPTNAKCRKCEAELKKEQQELLVAKPCC